MNARHPTLFSRALVKLLAAVTALALAGCASMKTLTSEVTAFNQWPEGRKPSSYRIEVLPSQAKKDSMQELIRAATPALEAAGFRPAAADETPDVLVNLGARVSANEPSPFLDPLWWRGGLYRLHGHGGPGPLWWPRAAPYGTYMRADNTTFDREVAILLRDRQSAQPLYEVRAVTAGFSSDIKPYLGAMFAAALQDFPVKTDQTRRVSVPLSK
jgi:hypothetical protein